MAARSSHTGPQPGAVRMQAGTLLLHVALCLGLGLLAQAHLRLSRQTNKSPVSGANVTHSTEYDEPSNVLRFRMEVWYGQQKWESGERRFPTPDGRVITIAWRGGRDGVNVTMEQQLPPHALLSQAQAQPATN